MVYFMVILDFITFTFQSFGEITMPSSGENLILIESDHPPIV